MKIAILTQERSYRGCLLIRRLAQSGQYQLLCMAQQASPSKPSKTPLTDWGFRQTKRIINKYKSLRGYQAPPLRRLDHSLAEVQLLDYVQILPVSDLNGPECRHALEQFKPELMLLCGANKLIYPEIFGLAGRYTLNLHSSLLPLFRGIGPFWSMYYQKPAGVTVHLVNDRFDAGEILIQRVIPYDDKDDLDSVNLKCDHVGVELMVEAVDILAREEANFRLNPPSKYWGRPQPWQYLRLWLRLINRNREYHRSRATSFVENCPPKTGGD